MNAIMACIGGRAPPGKISASLTQDLVGLTELAVLSLQGLELGGHVRGQARLCARCLARPCQPIDAAPAQCNRSCPQSRPALPNATYVHARDPKPSAPRELAPQARTCSLSCLSWLHPLKSWSLRQTRGGSLLPLAPQQDDLRPSLRFQRELRAADLARRSRARQELGHRQDAG